MALMSRPGDHHAERREDAAQAATRHDLSHNGDAEQWPVSSGSPRRVAGLPACYIPCLPEHLAGQLGRAPYTAGTRSDAACAAT
jgi:hypothetical protein